MPVKQYPKKLLRTTSEDEIPFQLKDADGYLNLGQQTANVQGKYITPVKISANLLRYYTK